VVKAYTVYFTYYRSKEITFDDPIIQFPQPKPSSPPKHRMSSKADDSKPIIYYWGGIKSRNFYMGLMLVGTGNNDKVR